MRRLADVGVAIGAAALGTGAGLPASAGLAASAAVAGADGHPVALGDGPALAGMGADLLDDTERFVPGDHRVRRVVLVLGLGALVLLVVAAADSAGLETEQGVVGADGRPRELSRLQGLGLDEHLCAHGSGHVGPPRSDSNQPPTGRWPHASKSSGPHDACASRSARRNRKPASVANRSSTSVSPM